MPIEALTGVAQPLLTQLGIETGKQRTEGVAAPPGRVLVRALCSLARHGQSLRSVVQAEDGCLLEAVLPSDLFSLEGELLVGVRRVGEQAEVAATVHIGGQIYDWGKSKHCLEQLFSDLAQTRLD